MSPEKIKTSKDKINHLYQKIESFENGKDLLHLLRNLSIPSSDKDYIATLLWNTDPKNGRLVEGIRELAVFADSDHVRRKIDERTSAEPVDIMEVISGFKDDEVINIVKSLRSIQMTDGCSVGCPWCGGCAKRGIHKKISLESFGKFFDKFGPSIDKDFIALYKDSDPFDWTDWGKTYVDLMDMTISKSNYRVFPYTSTAVPEGTEFTILRCLDKLHYIWSKDKSLISVFRFSETKENKERVRKILDILRFRGFEEDFIKTLTIAKRNEKTIQKVGYYIKHKGRNEIRDSLGISCNDMVFVDPELGLMASCMEAVTAENPVGAREWKLLPGEQLVPIHVELDDYKYYSDKSNSTIPPLIPEIECRIIRDGVVVGKQKISSVRRDILAFDCMEDWAWRLHKGMEKAKSKYAIKDFLAILRTVMKQIKPEIEARKISCATMLTYETDEEAKRTAKKYIDVYESWLHSSN